MPVTAYTIPGWLDATVVLLLLVGLVMGLAVAAAMQARSRLTAAPELALAAILAAGIAFTIVHAHSEDPYFGDQGTTYWQWGGISRSPTLAAVAVAGVALAWLLVNRRFAADRVGIRAAGLTVGGLAAGLLLIALFALSTGH